MRLVLRYKIRKDCAILTMRQTLRQTIIKKATQQVTNRTKVEPQFLKVKDTEHD